MSRDQRGLSLSVWLSVGMIFLILIMGIGVDFTGQTLAQQEARQVAAQAARAAGQKLDFEKSFVAAVADPTAGVLAARTYLAASSYVSSVTVETTMIKVELEGSYRTVFLSIIGINELPVRAHSQATLVRSLDGMPR